MKLYEQMRKPPWFLSASTWMTSKDRPIKAGPRARSAVIIPLLLMQYGSVLAKLRMFRHLSGYFRTSLAGMRESAKNLVKNPHTGTRSMDAQTLAELEAYARELGISTLGYTTVDPDHIFRGFEILYDKAIVLTMEMDKDRIAAGGITCSREIFRTYAGLGVAVNRLADWLRARGYDCHPSPAVGGDVNSVPVARDANLGCIGKNGILVTPEFGPCARLAAVFVDVDNLPLAGPNAHGWIAEFCETCNRCVRACPTGAIHQEPQHDEHGGRVYIDRHRCAPPFSEGCSICISSCVFTGGHYARLQTAHARRQAKQREQPARAS